MHGSRSLWFVTAAICGDQLLAKALLFRSRLACVTTWVAHLLQGFLQLQAVTLEPEFKCTKTATGSLSQFPKAASPLTGAPTARDSVLLGHPFSIPNWRVALTVHHGLPPDGRSDNHRCAQVPGHWLPELSWPLKDTWGNLKAT